MAPGESMLGTGSGLKNFPYGSVELPNQERKEKLAKKILWRGHLPKAAMMTPLPLNMEVCGTCAFWAGSRDFKTSGYLEVHPYSKGGCQGERFRFLAMAALATCEHWKGWPVG